MYLFRECGTSEDRTVGIFFYGCFIAADFGGICPCKIEKNITKLQNFLPAKLSGIHR